MSRNYMYFVLSYMQGKAKKENMSLDEAINDSENLTDFLLDFDEE